MSLRVATVRAAPYAVVLCLAGPVLAGEATVRPVASLRDREPSPAQDRQKRCANEWRALSAADKVAKGPAWPRFYSRCVKRLKAPKA